MPGADSYDILVIGSGEAGKYLAWTLAASGHRRAVVDRPLIGGCFRERFSDRRPCFSMMMSSASEVNLNSGGLESGEVHLSDRLAGPKIRCDLIAVGAGATTPEGNSVVDYSGTCTFKD